jgi:hypothetical protein
MSTLSSRGKPFFSSASVAAGSAAGPALTPLHRIEQETLAEGREWTRIQLRKRLQEEADRLGPVSLDSGLKLKRAQRIRRVLRTVCGRVELRLWYGYCPANGRPVCPACENWKMAPYQQLSPELEQRLCYTAAETGSYEKAARMAGAWGCAISDDAIHAGVARKGQQALDHPLTDTLLLPRRPFSLVIMMDGWLARHRDHQWGLRPPDRKAERIHWHEIKSAVIFRLEDRGETAGGRRFLIHKQVVAVPARTEPADFAQQVYREALRMGLAQAHKAYVIQDGAVYLWNIFQDRFARTAQGILDFYHASDHLWALAHELFGDGSDAAGRWAHPLLHQLRHGREKCVIQTLESLLAAPPPEQVQAADAIRTTTEYFRAHQDHIRYAEYAARGVPIGSGAMESQCSQYQNRLKRRGQFWSLIGSARLLAIVSCSQNQELHRLWAA